MPAIQNACLASLSAALLALLPACGEAPQKIDRPGGGAGMGGHSADDGHDHGAQTAAPSYSGVIVLRGPRALSDEGVLMVSLVSTGQRMPRMSYRISLQGAPPAINGERRVPFELNVRTDMLGGEVPPELNGTPLEVSVRYDQDGMVETKEGDVTVAVPVGWGAKDLEVVVGG